MRHEILVGRSNLRESIRTYSSSKWYVDHSDKVPLSQVVNVLSNDMLN